MKKTELEGKQASANEPEPLLNRVRKVFRRGDDEAADVSRRDLVTNLAVVAGAAGAAAFLSGCDVEQASKEAENEKTGTATDAVIKSKEFGYVDTVFGYYWASFYPFGRYYGDLCNTVPSHFTPAQYLVYAAGCIHKGDGGGGWFYWEEGEFDEDDDDNGTLVVPNLPEGADGRWVRQYTGPIDVRWFGGVVGYGDMDFPFQNAINAAARHSPGGSTYPTNVSCSITHVPQTEFVGHVFIPQGQYTFAVGLVIPRQGQGITIRGEGREATILRGWNEMNGAPMISFDSQSYATWNFCIEDLTIVRGPESGSGPCIVFDGTEYYRLQNPVFRNLVLTGWEDRDAEPFSYSAEPCLKLVHAHTGTFENLTITGGSSAIEITDCSRLHFVNTWINPKAKGGCKTGITILGGGSHTFRGTRIEAPGSDDDVGYGIYIDESEAEPSGILFDSLTFEGGSLGIFGGMAAVVKIHKGSHINFIDAHIYNQRAGGVGVSIDDGVHTVHFLRGSGSASNEEKFLEVAAGASDIVFDKMELGGNYYEGVTFDIASASRHVHARFVRKVWDGSYYRWLDLDVSNGLVGSMSIGGYAGDVRGYDIWRIGSSNTVQDLNGGYDGQIVTLILGASVTVNGSGNIKLAGTFTTTSGGTMRLVYDAANSEWQELSRSNNS